MNIPLRNEEEIEKIRIACQLAADVLIMIEDYIKEGVSTDYLDKICHEYMRDVQKTVPAPLNYNGYPKATCISVNEVVCHGIPSADKILKHGDILNIDVSLSINKYFGDTAKMYFVGQPSILDQRLCDAALESLYLAIKIVKPGIRLNQIGKTIQTYVEKQGFSVVREYCGHGIGSKLHCDPLVLHYYADDNGVILKEGMIFTIEPMINAGKRDVRLMKDDWTVKTKDRSHSAQYEHQIVVNKTGCEILTYRENEEKDRIPRILVNL